MSGIRRVFGVLATLLLAMASQGLMAQGGISVAPSEGALEAPQAIVLGGKPIFKIYEPLALGCGSGDSLLSGKFVNTPAGMYAQVIVVAGGLTYQHSEDGPFPEFVAEDGFVTLGEADGGGATDGVWPIPSDTEITITILLLDGPGGTVLYERVVVLSKCNGGEITSNQVVGEVSQPTRATFAVQKVFEDGNPADVEVTIDCNTGLILDQDKTISPGVPIEFVVTSFTNETLNCTITETPVDGYSPEYYDVGIDFDTEICEYRLVEDGEQGVCIIVNIPDPVEIEVTKNWVIEGDNNDVSLEYRLNMECTNGELLFIDGQEYFFEVDYAEGEGPGSTTHSFVVVPTLYTGANCSVDEYVYDSAIEKDNKCKNILVKAGGSPSCTITNTVFFEGVPTLSQYGMAILALLMLGMGFVGFRRFV